MAVSDGQQAVVRVGEGCKSFAKSKYQARQMLGSFLFGCIPIRSCIAKNGERFMTSLLVSKIQAKLRGALSPDARALLLAELACYFARTGEFEEAERIRGELRLAYADARSAPVSIMIMIAEALLLYFKELNPGARDRMLRANLLSRAFEEQRLASLSSAWLSHIDFNQGRYDSMVSAMNSAFEGASADDGSAMCRVAVVLGDAFAFCRIPEESKWWYERARQIAVVLGDRATIGALTYNKAALHVANLRLSAITDAVKLDEVALARRELQTATGYQFAAELKSLAHLLTSAAIGVAILESRIGDALAMLDAHFLEREVPAGAIEIALHRADLAMCLALVGRNEEAKSKLIEMDLPGVDALGADDRALIYESLSRAAEEIGMCNEAADFRTKARDSLLEHACLATQIGSMIAVCSGLGKSIC
ncbi:hypothetical protein [Rubrivivax sp. A210]|uniref:hypothetical protein n=1 Tax=Rubrivivax sp. A210 TaxID=2772301 RepID=UPI00191A0A51|nr:hypothetical protein [Rubrivivax sp. A210]